MLSRSVHGYTEEANKQLTLQDTVESALQRRFSWDNKGPGEGARRLPGNAENLSEEEELS